MGRLRSAAGVTSRWRPPKPPDEAGPARAGPSASGATLTALDDRGGLEGPPQPSASGATLTALDDRGGVEGPPQPSASGATLTALDDRGGVPPPQPPPPRRMVDEWLPPAAFLPPGRVTPTASGWTPWTSSQGTPHRPRHSGLGGPSPSEWSPQQTRGRRRAPPTRSTTRWTTWPRLGTPAWRP